MMAMIRAIKEKAHEIPGWSSDLITSLLKSELDTCTLEPSGSPVESVISVCQSFQTDQGQVFVKANGTEHAHDMFVAEWDSLNTITGTNTMQVPKPIKIIDIPDGGCMLVMEYVPINPLSKFSAELGEKFARFHQHNEQIAQKAKRQDSSVHTINSGKLQYVSEFGFHKTTWKGFVQLDNTWNSDWVSFYVNQRLKPHLDIIEKDYQDRELLDVWPLLLRKIPELFHDVKVTPSLLHGDMWRGNATETVNGPVVFDPTCSYGHNEFDLSMTLFYHQFSEDFHIAYHKVQPKAPGFDQRLQLYHVYNYFNHWSHFGADHKTETLNCINAVLKGIPGVDLTKAN